MKYPLTTPVWTMMTRWMKLLALAVGVAGMGASQSFANLTVDMRVGSIAGEGVMGNEKSVFLVGAGSVITFQIWAQVTAAGRTKVNNIFGVNRVLGSIVTSSAVPGGTLTGNMSPAVLLAPFNAAGSTVGAVSELSSPADGSLDVGTNGLGLSNDFISLRSNPTSGGEIVGGSFFVTNNVPEGATFNAIPGGYEFLMGTADFTVTSPAGEPISLNWKAPGFVSPLTRSMMANWTQGDGTRDNADLQNNLFGVGGPVFVSSGPPVNVPEPTTGALLALSLVGSLARRRGDKGRRL